MTQTSSNDGDREQAAQELNNQAAALAGCVQCRLSEGRTQVVFGIGSAFADLMFVGEGPGFNEDRQGEPFVGQAGKLLTELLGSIGLLREDVYIANVVKCRPPENRDPLPDEIEACSPNLVRQIQTIRPRIICTLGRFATRLVAETDAGISSIRGRAKQMHVAGIPVVVLPVFHPAAALYTPANRSLLEEDFLKLRRLLDAGERALSPSGRAISAQALESATAPDSSEPAFPESAADPASPPPVPPSSPAPAAPAERAADKPHDERMTPVGDAESDHSGSTDLPRDSAKSSGSSGQLHLW